MQQAIIRISDEIENQLIADRRDFHRYPELGWTEFRTASRVAKRLKDLGWKVSAGRPLHREEDRMGVPEQDVLEQNWQRALAQGGDPEFMPLLRGGYTGVAAVLKGRRSGPTLAMRFDMDALPIQESGAEQHAPAQKGFASLNTGVMHACGHDGHTAVGLGVAQVLAQIKDSLCGKVKLIFQPAEEGVRGARSMVSAGVVDHVDYVVGHHIYSSWALGETICGIGGFAATRKFDALLTGAPAHAGANPQGGRNALLAAATAVLNLYAIPRNGSGATRINVGTLQAGSGRNVIPAQALLQIETRGATSELNDYMTARAEQVLQAAAQMYGCELSLRPMGAAPGAESSPEFSARAQEIASEVGLFHWLSAAASGGSEDFTYFMTRVQEQGGQAVSIGFGADPFSSSFDSDKKESHVLNAHTDTFDFDERVLKLMVRMLSALTVDVLNPQEAERK